MIELVGVAPGQDSRPGFARVECTVLGIATEAKLEVDRRVTVGFFALGRDEQRLVVQRSVVWGSGEMRFDDDRPVGVDGAHHEQRAVEPIVVVEFRPSPIPSLVR